MIHLSAFLLVSGGVAVARALSPKKKKKVTWKKTEEKAASQEILVAEAVDVVPAESVSAEPEEEEDRHRFALSTGTAGLVACAKLGAGFCYPLSFALTGYLAAQVLKNAFKVIFEEKRIGVDILDATIVVVCLLLNRLTPAALILWILDFADFLQEKSRRKSGQYLSEIFGEQVRFAWLLVDEQEIEVPLDKLKKNDILLVRTGEQVPVDGVIVQGEAMLDQHSLTGEAAPVERRPGDEVFAMTVLVAGKIRVRVQETGENTLASKIIKIINQASEHKVELHSAGEKIADKMVIPTLALSAAGYVITGTGAMLAILNTEFGTGIRVAAPIALLASLGTAAKNGVLIKDSKVLEVLKEIDVVLFDKTGTLTHEVPTVANIVPADSGRSPKEILLYAAAAEQKFSHPIAKAILLKAAEADLVLPPHDESRYHVGLGIEVMVHGDLVQVGSARYMEQQQISISENMRQALQETADRGHTAILTAVNGTLAGMLELQSLLREEAVQVMQLLRDRDIKELVLISGDHEAPTKDLACRLGMDRHFAGVLPHQKADYVQLLQKEGKKVMMVGDGINDSAALSYADISVSLHGASTIAMDVADVIFMDGSLRKFAYFFHVSDVLHRNVKRSFYLIAIPNAMCIAGAMLGYFGLMGSLLFHNGFNVLAAANGMLPYIEADGRTSSQEKERC